MNPYICTSPIHPYIPIHQYVPHTSICSQYVMGSLGGTSVHPSDISVSVSTSIYPSVYNGHTSCSLSLWVTCSLLYGWLWYLCVLGTVFSLFYWTRGLWMYAQASCCWLDPFFVVFSLCCMLLLPWLWPPLLCLLCSLVLHISSQLLSWTPPLPGFQRHPVSMMWFFCHCWHWQTLEL